MISETRMTAKKKRELNARKQSIQDKKIPKWKIWYAISGDTITHPETVALDIIVGSFEDAMNFCKKIVEDDFPDSNTYAKKWDHEDYGIELHGGYTLTEYVFSEKQSTFDPVIRDQWMKRYNITEADLLTNYITYMCEPA